jgi:hypothetical protein
LYFLKKISAQGSFGGVRAFELKEKRKSGKLFFVLVISINVRLFDLINIILGKHTGVERSDIPMDIRYTSFDNPFGVPMIVAC